jgi:hypothetical protein
LSKIAAGNAGGRLVADPELEAGRAPVDELDSNKTQLRVES